MDSALTEVVAAWEPKGIDERAAAFARRVVSAAGPTRADRARSLLWVSGRLGAWAISVGLDPTSETLLHPSVIERFVTSGMARASLGARRTARTNLRFVARRAAPELAPPVATRLARGRAAAPYSPAEVNGFFALAAAQPTEARRHRLVGLLCLGLGAGIERGELRAVTGRHVMARSGGVVVAVVGPRARAVPVLARYHRPLGDAADYAGDRFICGGVSLTRRNVTTPLISCLAGGEYLPRLEVGRLRATWLAEQLARLGVPQLLAAAGVSHSQRIWDLAALLDAGDEAALVGRLG